jgi:hypothetical protein
MPESALLPYHRVTLMPFFFSLGEWKNQKKKDLFF